MLFITFNSPRAPPPTQTQILEQLLPELAAENRERFLLEDTVQVLVENYSKARSGLLDFGLQLAPGRLPSGAGASAAVHGAPEN